MTHFEELQSEINALALADKVRMYAALEASLSHDFGYDDVNVGIAEGNLAQYQAGQMSASSWDDIKSRLFPDA